MKTYESSDVLYILTISGDLADYYDGINSYGERANHPLWDELDDETKRLIVHSVRKALDGFMEVWPLPWLLGQVHRYIAFDAGINR